jgi:heme o synthase
LTADAVALTNTAQFATLRAYLSLTKPRIIILLLVTTVPAMVVAAGGWPSAWLVVATIIGGSASAGGANAVNCWYDRDIDGVMSRTQRRPMVTGEIQPAKGLGFGIALAAGSFVFLLLATTALAAFLSLAAFLFYVFVYTAWLKRRTSQNIVIGGAAGAFPPMIGWAAVTGDITVASLLMFGIVFLWTPPHFWALSLRIADDYAEAGVPMLPVTAGAEGTRTAILRYSWVLAGATLLLPLASDLSWVYLGSAVTLGAVFCWQALVLKRRPQQSPMALYSYSLLYLAALFVAMGVDIGLMS